MKKEETRLYNIIIDNIQDKYDYNELIKIIFKARKITGYLPDRNMKDLPQRKTL